MEVWTFLGFEAGLLVDVTAFYLIASTWMDVWSCLGCEVGLLVGVTFSTVIAPSIGLKSGIVFGAMLDYLWVWKSCIHCLVCNVGLLAGGADCC